LNGIIRANLSFEGGERLIFFQAGLLNKVEETHVSLQRRIFVLEGAASSILLLSEI
jgi:hypothetical protein